MDEINNNLITDENMTSQLYLDSMEHLNQLYKKYEIENQQEIK